MPAGPKGENRKADVIGNAFHIVRIATDKVQDTMQDDGKDNAAQTMGHKGSAARARSLKPEQRAEIARKAAEKRWGMQQAFHCTVVKMLAEFREQAYKMTRAASMERCMMDHETPQSKGGKARAEQLSAEARSDVARAGAAARWDNARKLPKATHGSTDHPLKIGNIEIPCYVLEDGTRVLSQRGTLGGLGLSQGTSGGTGGDRLTSFATGKAISPFVSNDLLTMIENPIRFRHSGGGGVAFGYPATILPEICEAVLAARQAGALQRQQMHIAAQCEALVRAFAKVGIVALVDEATGYQAERQRDELHRLLAAYLSEERLAWAKRFPDEFYKQVYRLRGWKWPVGKAKTPLLGHITNDVVYERLPPGVLPKLRELNPTLEDTKRRKHRHHQFLSEDVGQPDLRDHILQIIPLMKVSRNWDGFKKLLNVAFPKQGSQIEMDIDELN